MYTFTHDIVQLVLKLGYSGTHFSGFQAQTGQRTVAGELSFAFSKLLKREIELICAGRTDAGVHARSQYVNVPLFREEARCLEPSRFVRSLNAILPEDVEVYTLYFAARPDFSCRFDALSRSYVYRIATDHPSLVAPDHSWFVPRPLNLELMQEAAKHFLGEHDFTSYCKAIASKDKNCVRNVMEVALKPTTHFSESYLEFGITGSGFLHNMVRIMVGTLVEVGLKQRSPESVAVSIAAKDRRAAGKTAPAAGLSFEQVRYAIGELMAITNTDGGKRWD